MAMLQKNPQTAIAIWGFFLLGADELLTTYLYVGNCDRATVVIDAPAVLLDTIDTLCVGTYIVDIHGKNHSRRLPR